MIRRREVRKDRRKGNNLLRARKKKKQNQRKLRSPLKRLNQLRNHNLLRKRRKVTSQSSGKKFSLRMNLMMRSSSGRSTQSREVSRDLSSFTELFSVLLKDSPLS